MVEQQLKKKETRSAEERNNDLRSSLPHDIPAPGIPDIKKVELYSKYRPLIPQAFQDTTSPHPGKDECKDVLDRIKSQRNKKQQQRQQQKKRKKIDSKWGTSKEEWIRVFSCGWEGSGGVRIFNRVFLEILDFGSSRYFLID